MVNNIAWMWIVRKMPLIHEVGSRHIVEGTTRVLFLNATTGNDLNEYHGRRRGENNIYGGREFICRYISP